MLHRAYISYFLHKQIFCLYQKLDLNPSKIVLTDPLRPNATYWVTVNCQLEENRIQ